MTNKRKGRQIRQDILRYLLDRERTSDSSIPGLDEISSALGIPKEDVDDQLDILESQGAIKTNRTFSDAAPTLTGRGKAILEEMEEGGSTFFGEGITEVGGENILQGDQKPLWDAFICHASEDKDAFVRPLVNKLRSKGIRIWYDEFTLHIGDSLRRSIDEGLKKSNYGIVVLSQAFFVKKWPQKELDGLVTRERNGEHIILPVWFNVSVEDVARYSPPLADLVAAKASDGLDIVVAQLMSILSPNLHKQDEMNKSIGNKHKIEENVLNVTQSVKSPIIGQINLPNLSDNVLVGGSLDILAVAISPNYANDKTVWAGTFDSNTMPAACPQVFRSTDGGHKWVVSASALGAIGDKIVALRVSPNYAIDKTIFVSTQTPTGGPNTGKVYRSTDGGVTFAQLGVVTLAANEVITSMDVSPNYDRIGVIAVGVANINGAAYGSANANVQVWGYNGALKWTPFGMAATNDVMAVKFSPSYPVDTTLLVVSFAAADIGTGPKLHANVGGIWDAAIAATSIGASALLDYTSPSATGGTVAAAIVLPPDYNGSKANTRRAWIALVGQADLAGGITTSNNSGVYRVTGAGATASIGVITPLGSDLMGSLDYSGTFAKGTLVTGRYGHVAGIGANVYRTTNPADAFTSVRWYGATRPPTGTFTAIADTTTTNNAVPVAMDKNFTTSKLVVCGTLGTDSAFAISTDGSAAAWNETGLIDNAGLALANVSAITPSPKFATDKTIFLLTNDASGGVFNTSVWKTTNGGTTWLRLMVGIFTVGGRGIAALSPTFDTDQTLFIGDEGGLNVFYSTNGGMSWSSRSIPAIGITNIGAMAASDANTLYVADGGSGSVVKTINAGWVWSAGNVKATGSTGNLVSLVAKGTSVVVGDDAGSVFRSDDAGVTWAKV